MELMYFSNNQLVEIKCQMIFNKKFLPLKIKAAWQIFEHRRNYLLKLIFKILISLCDQTVMTFFFFFFTNLTVKMVSKMLTLLASAETKILVHEFL